MAMLADVRAAVPATLAAPLRTRQFLSHPKEGVLCWLCLKILHSEDSLLPWTLRFSKAKLPSELSLDICPSLTHTHVRTEYVFGRFRPNHFHI